MNKKDENFLEMDKDGLYINAPNYQDVRDRMDGHSTYTKQKKLDKIPKWIRGIFNAI